LFDVRRWTIIEARPEDLVKMDKPKLLLHICCAPCSTHVLNLLTGRFDVTGYFYNPNIHPESEYRRRLTEAERHCRDKSISLLPSIYQPRDWFSLINGYEAAPEGGARCAVCFRARLEETARTAAAHQFDCFGTTLTLSPHKDAPLINRIGMEAGKRHHLRFHEADFKKGNGYGESCRLSRALGLYRQNYCGCVFSKAMTRTGHPRQ
jgi:predicted adenine nucleotide alpha hydrolase (AANH) superfamily ATPase